MKITMDKHLKVGSRVLVIGYFLEDCEGEGKILRRNGQFYDIEIIKSGRIIHDLYYFELYEIKE